MHQMRMALDDVDASNPTSPHKRYGLTLTVDRDHNAHVLHVAGELDVAAAAELRESLDKIIETARPRAQPVVIDLTEATVVSAAGLRALIEAQHATPDCQVRIVATNTTVANQRRPRRRSRTWDTPQGSRSR